MIVIGIVKINISMKMSEIIKFNRKLKEMTQSELGEKIKALRESRGLTQRNLALRLEISNATISRIEKILLFQI